MYNGVIVDSTEVPRRLQLYAHLEELLNFWSYWEKHKEYYLTQLLPQLQVRSTEGIIGTERERDWIQAIRSLVTPEEWQQLPQLAREFIENRYNEALRQRITAKIIQYLGDLNVEAADKLYLQYPGAVDLQSPRAKFRYLQARRQATSFALDALEARIESGNWEKALAHWKRLQPHLSESERERFGPALRRLEEHKRRQIEHKLRELCAAGRFPEAEQLFQSQTQVSTQEYERIKLPYIEEFIKTRFGLKGDREKALTVAKSDKNVQVKARAGSGKTTTIACKTVWLIEKDGVDPDHILILAFNRKAAEEIRGRVRSVCKAFQNARTFHSLAHKVVRPSQAPLFDDGHHELSLRELSLFVQRLVKRIWNPVFHAKMYAFFRKEAREIERSGTFLSDEEYYLYRRNLPEITLGGERVKSRGEKYIADFLFEHGIAYQYERTWQWGKHPYRPDFTLEINGRVYVIEHWGVDETRTPRSVASQSRQRVDWEDYIQEMERKRAFWRRNHPEVVLIETSIRDLQKGREAFEERLRERLEGVGIACHKLPQEELLKKLKEIHLTRMTELFVQFIQRAKKKRLSPDNVKEEIAGISDPRTRVFWELAHRVYSEYEKALRQEGRYDFDDLLVKAIEKIHNTQGRCCIRIAHGREVALNRLQWILIDEYQDFSQLFYELIDAVRKYNPRVRLFCVGDDWQAINAFAGSDLHFFQNFSDLYGRESSGTATLLTNYRSCPPIVKSSNRFMKHWDRLGEPSRPQPERSEGKGGKRPEGKIVIEYVDDVWLKLEDPPDAQGSQDYRFLPQGNLKGFSLLLGRYCKKCYEIIVNHIDLIARRNSAKQEPSVAILARTNSLYGLSLKEFEEQLKSCFKEDQLKALGWDFLDVSTVHRYKGSEANIVILVEACERSFPLIHPDNQLFEPLGSTPQKVLDEEMRLFYVAITRARYGLWILTERGRESSLLKYLAPTHSQLEQKEGHISGF